MATQKQMKETINNFEKSVVYLSVSDINEIITKLNIEALNEFKKNKNIVSKQVFTDSNSNFVFMYFYWNRNKPQALQYVIDKNLPQTSVIALAELFVKTCFKAMALQGIKHNQPKKPLIDFYQQQVKGYIQFLKQHKKPN